MLSRKLYEDLEKDPDVFMELDLGIIQKENEPQILMSSDDFMSWQDEKGGGPLSLSRPDNQSMDHQRGCLK